MKSEPQGERSESSTILSGVESEILNEALQLSHAIENVKIYSYKEFDSAQKRFGEARKTATYAFWNEALCIKDRIFAAKLRIISEMLEYLDHPETAITGCLSFLKKLHCLPVIEEMFSVYLNRGLKSRDRERKIYNVAQLCAISICFEIQL